MILSRFPMGGSADNAFASGSKSYSANATSRSLSVTGLEFRPRIIAIHWASNYSSSENRDVYIVFNEGGTYLTSGGKPPVGIVYTTMQSTDGSFIIPTLFSTVGYEYSYGGVLTWYAS